VKDRRKTDPIQVAPKKTRGQEWGKQNGIISPVAATAGKKKGTGGNPPKPAKLPICKASHGNCTKFVSGTNNQRSGMPKKNGDKDRTKERKIRKKTVLGVVFSWSPCPDIGRNETGQSLRLL